MPGLYTEADYENSVVELFRNMGYNYLYGLDVERDFYNPLYEEELQRAWIQQRYEVGEKAGLLSLSPLS